MFTKILGFFLGDYLEEYMSRREEELKKQMPKIIRDEMSRGGGLHRAIRKYQKNSDSSVS